MKNLNQTKGYFSGLIKKPLSFNIRMDTNSLLNKNSPCFEDTDQNKTPKLVEELPEYGVLINSIKKNTKEELATVHKTLSLDTHKKISEAVFLSCYDLIHQRMGFLANKRLLCIQEDSFDKYCETSLKKILIADDVLGVTKLVCSQSKIPYNFYNVSYSRYIHEDPVLNSKKINPLYNLILHSPDAFNKACFESNSELTRSFLIKNRKSQAHYYKKNTLKVYKKIQQLQEKQEKEFSLTKQCNIPELLNPSALVMSMILNLVMNSLVEDNSYLHKGVREGAYGIFPYIFEDYEIQKYEKEIYSFMNDFDEKITKSYH